MAAEQQTNSEQQQHDAEMAREWQEILEREANTDSWRAREWKAINEGYAKLDAQEQDLENFARRSRARKDSHTDTTTEPIIANCKDMDAIFRWHLDNRASLQRTRDSLRLAKQKESADMRQKKSNKVHSSPIPFPQETNRSLIFKHNAQIPLD